MPGILPMKVIKVGTQAQSRIAQACDRCRSKKIRCDGVRPTCSQCANVGFECKTSDKLSRRAFPRGYTESLEERVRALELEVRELKDLLDEKDEKIDMLSRIHSQSSHPIQFSTARRPSTNSVESSKGNDEQDPDEVFKVQQSPYLLGEGADSYFAGTSSSRTFIEAFKRKVQETGKSTANISTENLLSSAGRKAPEVPLSPTSTVVWKAPPRLVSDQLINIFFQEWAPLFPVLHRPTFLALYEKYVVDSDSVTDKAELAQLNLVFGVAALSSGTRSSEDTESFESQWRAAVDAVLNENCMATLQALVLAQIFCIQQGDLSRLLTYKGLATTLSARLGLHQSQKRFALGTLTCETRKKVFWTLYTVDCFSSVTLGLPKHIKDDDVHCEYPVDADDEYVTERGFQPTLPGESTKLSSALALFKASRILSKVLQEVFPAKTSHELSLKNLSELSDELDSWHSALPPHLRLQFAQDKPSTGTISSRSPLLSLTYHYIRTLIQRPAICASLGAKASSAMIAHASSAKHLVQIVELLDERGLSFSFCLNKDEVLVTSGFGLLFQRITLDPSSKILKDNGKMITSIVDMLDKSSAPCAPEFKKVARSFLPASPPVAAPAPPKAYAMPSSKTAAPRHNSDSAAHQPASQNIQSSTKRQLKVIASRFTSGNSTKEQMPAPEDRRATVHSISMHPHAPQTQSQPSLSPPSLQTYSPATMPRSEPALSPTTLQHHRSMSTVTRPSLPPHHPAAPPKQKKRPSTSCHSTNLDYLSFTTADQLNNIHHQQHHQPSTYPPHDHSAPAIKSESQPTDWEKLLGSLDNGPTNIFDACYGGQPVEGFLDPHNNQQHPHQHNPNTHHNHTNGTSQNLRHASSTSAFGLRPQPTAPTGPLDWDASDLWALCHTDTNTSTSTSGTDHHAASTAPVGNAPIARNAWSFDSDEGDVSGCGGTDWSSEGDAYPGIVLPDVGGEGLGLGVGFVEGWGVAGGAGSFGV